jgi:hypothetical protein
MSGVSYKNPQSGAELRKSGVGNNAKPHASLKGGVGRDTDVRKSDTGPSYPGNAGSDHHKQSGFKGKGVL